MDEPEDETPCGRWEIEDGMAYYIEGGICIHMMPVASLYKAFIGQSKGIKFTGLKDQTKETKE